MANSQNPKTGPAIVNDYCFHTFDTFYQMNKKAFSKNIMLGVGILAAVVILLMQAFQTETNVLLDKAQAKESGKSGQEKTAIVAAPSDAVTSSQAVETDGTDASFIRELAPQEVPESAGPQIDKAILSDFLKTLFRVFISPQAP